jgi:hypothetical protein
LSFFLQLKLKKFFYFVVPLALGYLSCLGFLGIRPQIITWLFLSIFINILNSILSQKNYKLFFVFPILFFVWVNLHGGFFVGIFILFVVSFLKLWEKNYLLSFYLILTIFLSFFATLFNPYGIRIYEEVFRTVLDKNLSSRIIEWAPLLLFNMNFLQALFLVLFLILAFVILKSKEISFKNLVLPFIFLVFSFLHVRHFPLFVIITLPLLGEFLIKTREKIKPFEEKILPLNDKTTYLIFFFVFSLIIFLFLPLFFFLSPRHKGIIYPSLNAISFLKTLPPNENMFNIYEWGGYLIWQLPERKVFIDGRMPSWKKDGKSVMEDYLKIIKVEENFQEVLDKYEIKIILLTRSFKEAINPKGETLYQSLIKSGWKEIFEDETAIILKKDNQKLKKS